MGRACSGAAATKNTAVGDRALKGNGTGNFDTAVGDAALLNNTGSNNIALGGSAGINLTTGGGNIDIGNNGVAGESNTIRIGAGQTTTFIAGIRNGIGNGTGVAVYVDNTGQLSPTVSSARFKDDIRDMSDSTRALMKLRPVRFRYKKDIDPSGLEQYGLVAEEVAKVYPGLVVYDDKGQPQTVRYHFVNAMLLNEVQKQYRQQRAQASQLPQVQRDNAQLARDNATMREQLAHMEQVVEHLASTVQAMPASAVDGAAVTRKGL